MTRPDPTLDGATLPTGSIAEAATLVRPLPQLIVLARRDALAEPGSRHRLDGLDRVEIGRGRGPCHRARAALTLPIADRRLSTTHARLTAADGRWYIEDRGSTNGTLLDGHPVTRAPLEDGALIELGRAVLMYRDAVPVDARTPLDQPEDSLVGVAPAWRTFHDPLDRAWRRASRGAGRIRMLLRGPTGAGKEVAARALHHLADRPGPFIAVNCAGLPPELVAAELFGHVAGAYSGARAARPGYLRAADRGTLLLDEVDSLPLAAQAALLRPLAEGAVTPVGAERPQPVDVWVIAASNCDLDAAVEQGHFRADLLARLAEQTLALPALADRREDLGVLLRALLADALAPGAAWPRLDRGAARQLFAHSWPRNVRGLRSALRAGLARMEDGVLRADDLGLDHPPPATRSVPDERSALIDALRGAAGNARIAAARLGIARSTLYRRLDKHGVDADDYRP